MFGNHWKNIYHTNVTGQCPVEIIWWTIKSSQQWLSTQSLIGTQSECNNVTQSKFINRLKILKSEL